MDSFANRLRNVLFLKSKSQQLGAWIMLLSSLAFFNAVAWSPLVQFPKNIFSIVATLGVFLFGGILAHGIQKTTYRFVELVGVNFYIMGWALITYSLFIANTYLGLYFIGVFGVFTVFMGLLLYFMHKENPTRVIVETHALLGSFLFTAGAIMFSLAYYETEINLFYLVRVGRLPAFMTHRAIVSILVGIGFLLTSLFLFCLPPYVKGVNERFL